MKQIRIVLVFGLMVAYSFLHGQDYANFAQFYLNPYTLNPSFAGIDGKTSVSLLYRKQWANLEGSPSVSNFSLHTPVNSKLSTGLNITNDSRGLLNNTALLFTLGYNVNLHNEGYLRFAASAGGTWNSIDIEKLQSTNDPALANLASSHAGVAGNAGFSYHFKTFHIGFALPYIFSPSVLSESGFQVSEVSPLESSVIHTSYRFYAKRGQTIFEPYLLYRINTLTPSQLEAAGVFHFNNAVWLGGSYKQDFGISALGGLKLNNVLAIGLSYGIKNSGVNELNSPTFEIGLNMLLGKHKKNTHMYSFVDTHKEKVKKHPHHSKAAEIAKKHKEAEEARKRQLNAEAKKREAEELARHQALVDQKIAERKKDVVKPPPPRDTVRVHTPRFSQQQEVAPSVVIEGHHEHEKEQLTRLEVHKEDAKEHHGEEGHPHAERHEFVKRGGHEKELDVADYVIGGVFGKEENAKRFAEGLNKLGFHSHFGHLTEKNLWYVYLMQTTDINTAKAERDRVRKMKILKDAWLLTVHH